MARIRLKEPDPEELIARVESFRQNYFISRAEGRTGTTRRRVHPRGDDHDPIDFKEAQETAR